MKSKSSPQAWRPLGGYKEFQRYFSSYFTPVIYWRAKFPQHTFKGGDEQIVICPYCCCKSFLLSMVDGKYRCANCGVCGSSPIEFSENLTQHSLRGGIYG